MKLRWAVEEELSLLCGLIPIRPVVLVWAGIIRPIKTLIKKAVSADYDRGACLMSSGLLNGLCVVCLGSQQLARLYFSQEKVLVIQRYVCSTM